MAREAGEGCVGVAEAVEEDEDVGWWGGVGWRGYGERDGGRERGRGGEGSGHLWFAWLILREGVEEI